MEWDLDFISEDDFKNHVRATIMKYGEKLKSYLNTHNLQVKNEKISYEEKDHRLLWLNINNR